jgi:hypothetical protein
MILIKKCNERLKVYYDGLFFITNVLGVFKLFDVSKAGSVSVTRSKRGKDCTQLGPLDRPRLHHWA